VTNRSRLRLLVLRVLVVSLLLTLIGRLYYLEVLAGGHYRQAAADNQLRTIVTAAPRGQILDDAGRALATNRIALVVSVDLSVLDRQRDGGVAVLNRLATVIGTPYRQLRERLRLCGRSVPQPCWNGSPYQPIPVSEHTDNRVALQILEDHERFPGVSAQIQAIRVYPGPAGITAPHLLGYLGPISPAELAKLPASERDARRNDLVGRDGLEAYYDSVLRGTAGLRTVSVDHLGAVTGLVSQSSPTTGDTLVTSLDANVQRALEDGLAQAVATARSVGAGPAGGGPADAASGVVLDARTGHVIAMASYPTYNPNVWVGGISQREYDALQQAPGAPLIDQATNAAYAPGSIFKLISTSGLVMEGTANLGGTYDCTPSFQIGGQVFHNFEGEAFGYIDLRKAIIVSCDTVFYGLAYRDWQSDNRLTTAGKPAVEAVQHMARAFGLGAPTGIDLPGEASGNIEDRASRRAYWTTFLRPNACKGANNPAFSAQRRADDAYYCQYGYLYFPGDQVNFDIGQGTVLATPLQMAVAYAALINGGVIRAPRIASAVLGPSGRLLRRILAPVRGHVPVSPGVLAYIESAMDQVTKDPTGTAHGAFVGFPFGTIDVGGKTGTAEGAPGEPATAWFASFAGPPGNPRYVSVIQVHHGGQGGRTAAPATRALWDAVFGLEGHRAALSGGLPPPNLPKINPDGTVVAAPVVTSAPSPGSPSPTALGLALPPAVLDRARRARGAPPRRSRRRAAG